MVRDGGSHPDDAQVDIAAAVFARLTARQRLVSIWMTAGFSDEDIARHLGVADQELYSEVDEIARIVRRVMP
jgi:hypothetical protein